MLHLNKQRDDVALQTYSENIETLIRRAAFDLLARREYSQQELQEKLLRKFNKRKDLVVDREKIAGLVSAMGADGLQSDSRYLEMLIRSRIQQGQGPLRIAQELKQKGIDAQAYEALLDSRSEDWCERARQVKLKKFGSGKTFDQKLKSRQLRFLQYRGFSSQQVRFAMESEP